MAAFEAAVAGVASGALTPQRHHVHQAACLQRQQGVTAVKGAVQGHATQLQAVGRELVEQSGDGGVGLGPIGQRQQVDGEAAVPVQQAGGGVAEEELRALLFRAAHDVGGGGVRVAVVGDEMGVEGDQPAAAAVGTGEVRDVVQGRDQPVDQSVEGGAGWPAALVTPFRG